MIDVECTSCRRTPIADGVTRHVEILYRQRRLSGRDAGGNDRRGGTRKVNEKESVSE